MTDLRNELEIACRLARAAGEAAMRFYGTSESTAKRDTSPVTLADHAANDVILEGLQEAFPDDSILSEESADSGDRLTAKRVWIVDPLDGTKEFLARNGEFCIMIGLAVDGEAVLGAVYLPDGDVLYGAARGLGTWVETSAGRRQLTRGAISVGALRLVGSRSHADPLLDRMQAELGISDVIPCGSVGVKCSRILEDARDLYVHPVPYLKEWDTCAPEVLVREAGGWVSDCNGEPLRYNKPDPVQPHGILVCAPGGITGVLPQIRSIYSSSLAGAPA
jgi:3'(2'), 5'-bisphosphate nucleotidase